MLCLFAADVVLVEGRLGVRRVDRELGALHVTHANVIREELKEGATATGCAPASPPKSIRVTRTLETIERLSNGPAEWALHVAGARGRHSPARRM